MVQRHCSQPEILHGGVGLTNDVHGRALATQPLHQLARPPGLTCPRGAFQEESSLLRGGLGCFLLRLQHAPGSDGRRLCCVHGRIPVAALEQLHVFPGGPPERLVFVPVALAHTAARVQLALPGVQPFVDGPQVGEVLEGAVGHGLQRLPVLGRKALQDHRVRLHSLHAARRYLERANDVGQLRHARGLGRQNVAVDGPEAPVREHLRGEHVVHYAPPFPVHGASAERSRGVCQRVRAFHRIDRVPFAAREPDELVHRELGQRRGFVRPGLVHDAQRLSHALLVHVGARLEGPKDVVPRGGAMREQELDRQPVVPPLTDIRQQAQLRLAAGAQLHEAEVAELARLCAHDVVVGAKNAKSCALCARAFRRQRLTSSSNKLSPSLASWGAKTKGGSLGLST